MLRFEKITGMQQFVSETKCVQACLKPILIANHSKNILPTDAFMTLEFK